MNYTGCGITVTGSTANPSIVGNDISRLQIDPMFAVCSGGGGSGTGIGVSYAYGADIVGNTIENSVFSTLGGLPGSSSIYAGLSTTVLIQNNILRNNANGNSALYETDVATISIIQNLIYNNSFQINTSGLISGGPAVELYNTDPYMAPHTQSITFNNNTLFGNTVRPGQQGSQFQFTDGFDSGVSATFENNIFISNASDAAVECAYPPTDPLSITFSHNDVLNADISLPAQGCTSKGPAVANLAVDPQFLNPAGGDFHTQRTSPVVAAGDINAPQIPPTDLDIATVPCAAPSIWACMRCIHSRLLP